MATSAVSVTGLVVQDLATEYTVFGQVIILVLIQIGGIGYMLSATVLGLLLGRRIGLRDRLVMQEALNTLTLGGMKRLAQTILTVSLFAESVGAAILTIRFLDHDSFWGALYLGVFHSVASFNNAGFSLFSDNLMGFKGDVTVNLTVMALTIVGGLGFIVYSDLYKFGRSQVFRISTHTKIVLWMSGLLAVIPGLFFLYFEWTNPRSLSGLAPSDRILSAYFQTVMTRTSGFNTLNIGTLQSVTLYMLLLLMFIGGSPNGTAGGIKTTTFATMVAALWATARGRSDAVLFHRRLPQATVARAFLLAGMSFVLVTLLTFILAATEKQPFLGLLFETVSAFGTVGLSTGDGGVLSLSAQFGEVGKWLIVLAMFVGRVGPLTVGAAIVRPHTVRYRVPEDRCLIG